MKEEAIRRATEAFRYMKWKRRKRKRRPRLVGRKNTRRPFEEVQVDFLDSISRSELNMHN